MLKYKEPVSFNTEFYVILIQNSLKFDECIQTTRNLMSLRNSFSRNELKKIIIFIMMMLL